MKEEAERNQGNRANMRNIPSPRVANPSCTIRKVKRFRLFEKLRARRGAAVRRGEKVGKTAKLAEPNRRTLNRGLFAVRVVPREEAQYWLCWELGKQRAFRYPARVADPSHDETSTKLERRFTAIIRHFSLCQSLPWDGSQNSDLMVEFQINKTSEERKKN